MSVLYVNNAAPAMARFSDLFHGLWFGPDFFNEGGGDQVGFISAPHGGFQSQGFYTGTGSGPGFNVATLVAREYVSYQTAFTFFSVGGAYSIANMASFHSGGADSAAFLLSRADTIYGNAAANRLEGYAGSDTLYGYEGNDRLEGGTGHDTLDGGADADTMIGGAGNDTYFVDNTGDTAIEKDGSGEGEDTVNSLVTYTLKGQYVEHLNLTGANAIDGTGNKLDNTITGNSNANKLYGMDGNDTLDGGSGGADTFYGGTGDDTFVVNSLGDLAVEKDGEGYDTVRSSVTYTLKGQYSEALLLTGGGAIDGTGNKLDNTIVGNAKTNIINGMVGNDTLTGGLGADRFVFDQALVAANVDTITDFSAADSIRLDDAVFKDLPLGVLSSSAFRANTSGNAGDSSDRIIYETDTGELYFDRDGTGGTYAPVLFARIPEEISISAADFAVI